MLGMGAVFSSIAIEVIAPEPLSTPPRTCLSAARKSGPLCPPCECPMKMTFVASKRIAACVVTAGGNGGVRFREEPRELDEVEAHCCMLCARPGRC